MRLAISCLTSNRILIFDEQRQEIVRELRFAGRNRFDILHSIRPTRGGYLVSSTYGLHLVAADLSRVQQSWSLERLSNVHAADPLDGERALISNTGWDELLRVRLGREITVEAVFDAAAWAGKAKRLELRDRRDEPRVSASQDWTHLNCAHVANRDNRTLAYCCLFHFGLVLVIDVDTMTPVDEIRDVGKMPHSSIPVGDRLFVCSSQESLLRVFDLTTRCKVWEYEAPFRPWVRSAWPIGEDVVFTAEKDRSAQFPSRGYVARVSTRTGATLWRLELDVDGPFDVIEALAD